MRKFLIWLVMLAVGETVVVILSSAVSSDVAALTLGVIVGILFAGLAALITAVVREDRDRRDRREADEAWRRQPARETWTDAAWREWTEAPTPSTNLRRMPERMDERAIEAPERALVKR